MGGRNDDISLKLAKAVVSGFLPDVKDQELDYLQEVANDLFGTDGALNATYATHDETLINAIIFGG